MAYQYSPAVFPALRYGFGPGPGVVALANPAEPNVDYSVTPGSPAAISGGIPGEFGGDPQKNPLYVLAQQGANYNAPMGAMTGIAQNLQNAFTGNLAFANQALNLAFDPQQALFQQRQRDLIDATRAGEAARGISMTPFGASIESEQVARFYNEWQNEQVARMAQGASAATALQGMYSEAQQAAAGIYNNEAQNILQNYNLQGTFMNDALNEILQATKISADVATAQYEAATRPVSASSGGGGQARGGGLGQPVGTEYFQRGEGGGAVSQAVGGGGEG